MLREKFFRRKGCQDPKKYVKMIQLGFFRILAKNVEKRRTYNYV